MEEQFRREGILDEKQQFIDIVLEVNRSFPEGTQFNLYDTERMIKVLTDYIGFESILHHGRVYDQNFLIAAKVITLS